MKSFGGDRLADSQNIRNPQAGSLDVRQDYFFLLEYHKVDSRRPFGDVEHLQEVIRNACCHITQSILRKSMK